MAALKSVPREVAPQGPRRGDVLSRFTHDLVERARREGFDPVIGRDVEVRRLLQILERRQKNHPLLVGEAGVGKTAIVGALAMRIAAGDVPESLAQAQHPRARDRHARRRRQAARRDRGAAAPGASRRVKTGLEGHAPLRERDRLAARPGRGRAAAWATCSKPLLARGEVRLLASTTVDGAKKMQERDPGLLRRFSVLDDRGADARPGHRDPARHRVEVRGAPQGADRRGRHRRRGAPREAVPAGPRAPRRGDRSARRDGGAKARRDRRRAGEGRRGHPPPRVAQGAGARRSRATRTR